MGRGPRWAALAVALAVAGVLATGLLGLEKGVAAKTPNPSAGPVEEDDSYEKLPATLEESLDALNADTAFADLLGSDLVTAYTVMRQHEIARFRAHITDWESSEYLELY